MSRYVVTGRGGHCGGGGGGREGGRLGGVWGCLGGGEWRRRGEERRGGLDAEQRGRFEIIKATAGL